MSSPILAAIEEPARSPGWRPLLRAASLTGAISTQVGPGSTELTVTLVPLVCSAAPRAITSWAPLEKP